MSDSTSLTIALVAAGSATFVGIISYFGGRASTTRTLKKEVSLKVAEYRLAWINEMNTEIATFAAASLRTRRIKQREDPQHISEALEGMYKAGFKIRLLMNRRDANYDELSRLLTTMASLSRRAGMSSDNGRLIRQLRPQQDRLIELGNAIAKYEWQKTKYHLSKDTISISALRSSSDEEVAFSTLQQLRPLFVSLNNRFNSVLPSWLRDPETRSAHKPRHQQQLQHTSFSDEDEAE